jgi:hypothetical protein
MRLSVGVAILIVLLTACESNQGIKQAEALPTPLTGVVLAARAGNHKCSPDGCLFIYRLRVTNPMDRAVNVQECRRVDDSLRLPLTGVPAGVEVSANATITVGGTFLLPVAKDEAKGLLGVAVTCTGIDWHSQPPV